jgi:outer membrane protein insertion porin family
MTLLLSLLLALPPQDVMAAEGVTVTAVHLDLPPKDLPRYATYVDLRPGDALRRAQIRHIVQLLYATGAFEDVVVEAKKSPLGVEVTFKPSWAPLLREVRITGDRLLSPKDVAKIAKLRKGEPLWDTRLEKAGRDVALSLTARGYLEARVGATSERHERVADAVFAVHAGPRVVVSELKIDGAAEFTPFLVPLAKPKAGAVFQKSKADAAAEAMKKKLLEADWWDASVEHREIYDPSRGRVALVFEVHRGTHAVLEVRGTKLSTSLRASLDARLREGGLRPDVVEEVADRVERDFLSRGYRDVAVEHREESRPGGKALIVEVKPGPEARVASVQVVGAEQATFKQPLLQTRVGAPLEDSVIDQDSRNLSHALEEEGYATSRVDAEVPDGGGDLNVVFRVSPGPRTFVTSVTIDASPAPPGVTFEHMWVKKGAPYRSRDVARDSKDLAAAYENGGYLRAEVHPDVAFTEDRTGAAVTIRAVPGQQTRVDRILITGLQQTRPVVVQRELYLREGDPLGVQKVLEDQRRLSNLGIFSRATITEMDPDSPDRRSLIVHTEEAPRTTIAYGVGYAERDLLRGSVEVTERNLGGMDRTLSLFVRGSFAGNREILSYREPYPLGKKGEILVSVYHEDEALESFSYSRTGATLQTARNIFAQTHLLVRYVFQKTITYDVLVPLDEVDREFQNSTFSGPAIAIVNDTRDDPADPSRGHFVSADAQLSSKGLGGDSFVKGFLQTSTYRGLTRRVLLALSARVGLAKTFNGEPPGLPLPDRFFAGGDYSIRGFAIDTAGPLAPSSTGQLLPTGGNATLVGSAEFRIDTGNHFQVAVFSDFGNVYPLVHEMSLGDILYTAGVGLRYRSAVGPIRVDYGYKLNKRPSDVPGHLHITVGYAF